MWPRHPWAPLDFDEMLESFRRIYGHDPVMMSWRGQTYSYPDQWEEYQAIVRKSRAAVLS